MIETEKLSKFYGDRAAVRDLTFQVGKGEIVGLLGPNGAGKTTTMRMLTGYLPADGGRAIVAGYDVAEKPMEVRKRLGYLPETVPLYTEMPVSTYLDFVAKIRGVPAKGRKRRIEEVMELCRIADVKNKIIGKLSRGYKQRVGLAQAIVHNPPVIILDEPTVGLDPRQIIEIRKVIRDLAGNHSMILSTHILPEVSALCDRVVIVNRGRVLVEDTLNNLEQRGSEGQRLRLEVRGPQDPLVQLLTDWPGVMQVSIPTRGQEAVEVTQPTDIQRLDLKLAQDADVREAIAGAIIGQGWGLLELKTVSPSLEEIFVQLITDDLRRLDEEEGVEAGGNAGDNTSLASDRRVAYDDEMDAPVLDETAESEDEAVAPVVTSRRDGKRKAAGPLVSSAQTRSKRAAPAFLSEEVENEDELDLPPTSSEQSEDKSKTT